jgi:hypothetical protein
VRISKLASAFLVVLSAISLLFGAMPASAATTKATSAPVSTNQSLKVSPLRTDITIQPGTTGKVQTYVTNLTNASITIQPIENDFVAGDEEGNPAIILSPNSYAPTHSLKRFMVPLQNVTIAAGVTQEVDLTIAVPKDAQAGGYFGAIRFAPATADADTSVDLNASVASLVLMTVPGPTVEQLTLTNFDVQQNGGSATNFRTPSNLSLFARFENKGNLQEAPFGQIYVQKGKEVVYTYNFNQAQPQDEILPDSARRWTVPIKGMGKFGKYTVGATFTYGTKGETIDITKTIWIIPTTYILAAVVIVVVLVIVVGGSWLFLRSYKRRILKSSRRRY